MTFKNSGYLDNLNPLFLIWYSLFISFSELFWPVFLVLYGIKLVTAKFYLHLQIFRGQVFTIDSSCEIYWISYRWILWYYHILSISNLFTAFINNRCWLLLKHILLLFQIAIILNIFLCEWYIILIVCMYQTIASVVWRSFDLGRAFVVYCLFGCQELFLWCIISLMW